MTARRIVLIRHGRPAHAERGWFDASAMQAWMDAYDAAGLAADDEPPAALVALAREAAIVATSDLPRALESAARLAPDAPVVQAPLLRETPPAFPSLGPLRLPLAGWALAVGVRLALHSARGVPAPTPALRQAREAAAWLAGLADAHGLVVAVTHASVRGLIASALDAGGWSREPLPRHPALRYAHWSAWAFTPIATGRTSVRRAVRPADAGHSPTPGDHSPTRSGRPARRPPGQPFKISTLTS
jgi:broad specificity phosphatase PhoE